MTILTTKAPADILAYDLDFAPQLGDDCISTFVASVDTGTVDIERQTNTPQGVRLLISGGAADEDATLSVAIVTLGGQNFTQAFTLPIRTGAQAAIPSTATKRAIIEMTFEEMTLAGYEFDATPEEQAAYLRQLDAMMAEWRGPGRQLAIPYNAPAVLGEGNFEDESGVPDFAIQAVAISLAKRCAPKIGKTLSPETQAALVSGMDAINAAFSPRVERRLGRTTPRGAGNRWAAAWDPFFRGSGGCR